MKKLILFIIHCISSILWVLMIILATFIFIIEWKDVDVDNDLLKIHHKIWKD